MTNRIILNRLAFSGPGTGVADLRFTPGLNLVYGASNTGKSFAIKTIDFALGGNTPVPDNRQRQPFDRTWLAFSAGDNEVTLTRALAGGNFELVPGHVDSRTVGNNNPRILAQRNDPNRDDNVSQFLLAELGLRGKQVAMNASGRKRPLSFRDLSRYCLIDETSIQSEDSPALSGQHVTASAERSVFKLLLSGVDDSALIEVVDRQTFRASTNAKLELVDEMIETVEGEIEGDYPDAPGLKDQDDKLEGAFLSAQSEVDATQGSIRLLLATKRHLSLELSRKQERLGEIEMNVARFVQLHAVYQSDIERLEALEEAGFLLALGSDRDCPLCGASPDAQRHEHGLGDIERVSVAAAVEITKIKRQQIDLTHTVQQLHVERVTISEELPALSAELSKCERELERLAPEVGAARQKVTEIMTVRDRVKRGLSLLEQLDGLRKRRESLNAIRPAPSSDRPKLGVSGTVAHDFTNKVSEVLTAWHFPGRKHVSFDEATSDLMIDGKLRRNNGKGVRAITHAAFKVAVLLFCRERDLPHPGFLVLDTPLLTYRDPLSSKYGDIEGDEKELSSSSLKQHFFAHLSGQSGLAQFIVLENVDPPDDISSLAHVQVFSGDETRGRAGLFPAIS